MAKAGTEAFYGRREETSVFALAGDVRYVVALALRKFVDDVLLRDGSSTRVVDLRKAVCVDSTGLGLLAHIGRTTIEQKGRRAVLVVAKDGPLGKMLRAVAFDVVFDLLDVYPLDDGLELQPVVLDGSPLSPGRLDAAHAQVMVDAHEELMALSDENRQAFADVVAALKAGIRR
jgi:ABC-type transporter Mla MlaB component